MLLGMPQQKTPDFIGKDKKRKKIPVNLTLEAEGFSHPTDIQFLPGSDDTMIVLEKEGQMIWVSRSTQKRGTILKLSVTTRSERGLLGLAFHPHFKKNNKFYLNYTTRLSRKNITRISEWTLVDQKGNKNWKGQNEKILLEVEQPFANHNAGQLAFGPDGFLYIGLGDGGSGGDPYEHGQNPRSLLGKMLRIDVDHPSKGKAYGIPKSNPFVGNSRFLPEIWAWGLRNPWRYSFGPNESFIVADVGQYNWEEISILKAGKNYGWNIKEGNSCYSNLKKCKSPTLVDPIWEYDRDDGGSITGGYIYTGSKIQSLKGKYVFGDFVSGKIWAIDLPKKGKASFMYALGHWPTPFAISTFGQDSSGEIYVGEYLTGTIFRLAKR